MTPWLQRLDDLLSGRHTTTGDELDAGAQIIITDPDGTEIFRAALARMHRIDDTDTDLVWVRPVFGSTTEHGTPVFPLGLLRRRGLSTSRVHLEDSDIVLRLGSGQTARIQPATGDELTELQRWDTFYYLTLTDDETTAMGRLAEDSWTGRFS